MGISFGKLLVLAAVGALVWFGWRKIAAAGQALQSRSRRPSKRPVETETVDLVRDPVTGLYEPTKRD